MNLKNGIFKQNLIYEENCIIIGSHIGHEL